jgi:hypothetical protein
MADRELAAVYGALADLEPSDDEEPSTPRPAVGEPGVLEDLARAVGLEPVRAGMIDTPYESPALDTLVRAIVDGAGFDGAVRYSGSAAVREAVRAAAEPFRRPDGSYRFENRFRYLIARH